MHLRQWIVGLPRSNKRALVVTCDILLCLATVYAAFYFRTGVFHMLHPGVLTAMAVSVALALPLFVYFGLYRTVFRYEGISSMVAMTKAMLVYGVIYCFVFTFVTVDKVPRTLGYIQPILLYAGLICSRGFARYWLSGEYRELFRRNSLPHGIIYGCGDAGRQLLSALNTARRVNITAFVDDDPKTWNLIVNGVTVYSPKDLPRLIEEHDVNTVLLAVPSASAARRKAILHSLATLKVEVRTLPAMAEIAAGKISVVSLREVAVEELLGRDPVKPVPALMTKTITGKVVMVTGAGGSIGSELCRQILRTQPKTLLLVERAEYSLYAIYHELTEKIGANGIEVIPLLADVQDGKRLNEIMKTWGVQTVYHAAAYKHVPMVEHNPLEGVRNNVFGTLTCARTARDNGVEEFVLISTDKAVRPTNVMGATKRLCELVLQALASEGGKTIFTMVRFGNVLGSSGSVVPRFKQQIQAGGPVTLTHKDIVRYFMTIPEASQLVIQAAALGRGGDVFLLDMGEPVKIADLAKRMIELSGYRVKDEMHPDGDIEIQVTGLRPGEKLYEELLIRDNPMKTEHPRIFRAKEVSIPAEDLLVRLQELKAGLEALDRRAVMTVVKGCVPEYQPKGTVEDWVMLREGVDSID